MNIDWKTIWEAHPDLLIARNWIECPEDRKKENRLSPLFEYFMGGETTLRVGIIASDSSMPEGEFLLSGILWGNRLSNGAKTVIYFVAPDFSASFLNALTKIGGNISARAVYWREKLTPSLYLIPEKQKGYMPLVMGEERPDWRRWGQGLNPVAQQQLKIVEDFFAGFEGRRVQAKIKHQQISFHWGHLEIGEIRKKGKKFELSSKVKWLRDKDLALNWQKLGWVDASGLINAEFAEVMGKILDLLESMEKERKLRPQDLLALWLQHDGEGVKTLWGSPWLWPWLPKDRAESAVLELDEWYFYQKDGLLNVVCPIFDKPLYKAAQSILLASVLEGSLLVASAKDEQGGKLAWDGRIHWLTSLNQEEELRRWYSWLTTADEFQLWTLPEDWREKGIYELNCKTPGSANERRFLDLS